MPKKMVFALVLTMFLVGALSVVSEVSSSGGTTYIRADGTIDQPSRLFLTNDNITYYVNYTFYLEQVENQPMIVSIVVERDNIMIDGLGSGYDNSGISVVGRQNVTIRNIGFGRANPTINIVSSSGINVYNTDLRGPCDLIHLVSSSNCTIYGNKIDLSNLEAETYGDIVLSNSSNNVIFGNVLAGSETPGIFLNDSSNNRIEANNFTNSGAVEYAGECVNNRFFHNNFFWVLAIQRPQDFWDNGYPSGGNSYSYYSGVDLYRGKFQNETGSDGIGDTPYERDNYPLMKPWSAPSEIIVDDVAAVFVGSWPLSTVVSDYYGSGYRYRWTGSGSNKATWSFNVSKAGSWEVFARWTDGSNRAANAPYTVNHAGGSTVVRISQKVNGGVWVSLGVFSFNMGTGSIMLSDNASDVVIADAVRLVYVESSLPPPPPADMIVDDVNAVFVGSWPLSTVISGYYGSGYRYRWAGTGSNRVTWSFTLSQAGSWEVFARWTSGSSGNRATNAPYTINSAGGSTVVAVNQKTNGGVWVSLGVYSFNTGTASIMLSDNANDVVIADAIRLTRIG